MRNKEWGQLSSSKKAVRLDIVEQAGRLSLLGNRRQMAAGRENFLSATIHLTHT